MGCVLAAALAGAAALGDDIVTRLADFDQPSDSADWASFWSNGGAGRLTHTTAQVKSGEGAAMLHGAFSVTNGYFVLACATPIPPDTTAIRMWVYGDASGHALECRIIDRTSETFLYPLAETVDWTGWRLLTATADTPARTWGGNQNARIDNPARLALQASANKIGKVAFIVDEVELSARLTAANRIVMESAGEPAGHIWFGARDAVAVNLSVRDRGGAAADLKLEYRVIDWNDETICKGTQLVQVVAGPSPTAANIAFSTQGRFGHYRIAATLRRSDGTFVQRVETTAAVVPGPQKVSGSANPFGMNLSVARRYAASECAAGAALARQCGVGWSREEFSWEAIESTKGTFAWDTYDKPMQVAAQADLKVLGLLGYAATWARRDSAVYTSPPRDVADYSNFVYQVVNRYKGQIKHWEIWNEPDSPVFWPPKPDAAAYTALLKAAYAAAKRADPSCHVLTAGLLVGMNHRDNWVFLEDMYRQGAKEFFDILAWHAYCDPRSPEEGGYAERLKTLRQIMAKHGDADKPLWLTEEGWATAPGHARSVGAATQAQYMVRAHVLSLAAHGVEKYFWFLFRDGGNWESDFDQSYGILRPDNTPKPAFVSYAAMTHALQGKAFVGTTHLGTTGDLACHAFAGEGEATVVICHTGAGEVILRTDMDADPMVSVRDRFGNAVAPAADKLALTVDAAPIYIVAPTERLAQIQAKLATAIRSDRVIPEKELRHCQLLEDFEAVGWGSEWKLGWPGSGHEGTVLSASQEQVKSGKAAGKLAFQLDPAKGKYGLCYAQVDRIVELPDEAGIVGVWVYGDSSGSKLAYRILDRNDETYQYVLAEKMDWRGWRYLEARIDRPASHFGGDKNGRLDSPLRFQCLIVSVMPARKTEGVVFFDDLVVKY